MKAEALAMVADVADPTQKLNLLREYLQALTLRSLHESEALLSIALVGGTALRFLYALPRFSEDIDFSLHKSSKYRPRPWMSKIKKDLTLAGFDTRVTWNEKSPIHKAWIKTSGIMFDASVSPFPAQNLSIKLEIDTRPPAGAAVESRLITRHRLLALQHYDLHSLMAGKLHALITRGYSKGRDWYDIVWYRGRTTPVEPNLDLLQNALDQTHGINQYDAREWKSIIRDRIAKLDDKRLIADVSPFLERPEEAALLRTDHILSVV